MTTKELGDLGEKMACEYLVEKRFKILGKNYRITFGEIDVVAAKKGVIHFVEVKTIASRGNSFFPEQHVDYKKQRKLRNMVQIWLSKNPSHQKSPCQIDIVAIVANPDTRVAKLHYFPNAIEEV